MRTKLSRIGQVVATLLLGAFCATLSACSSRGASALPDKPMWRSRPAGVLGVVARRQLTDVNQVVGEEYERGRPCIDPFNNRVYVGSSDRGLYAINAADLSTAWRFQTVGVVQSEPFFDGTENVVYFGSNDGALYKVKADTGALLWRFSTNAEVSRAAVVVGDRVFAANSNDTVVAINRATGNLIWQHHRTPAGGMEIAGYSGPAYADGRLFFAFSDGRVAAFDASNGTELWSVDLAAEAEQSSGDVPRHLDADATPLIIKSGGVTQVIVASYAGGVHSLDGVTGGRNWSNDRVSGVVDLMYWGQPARPNESPGGPTPARKLVVATGTSGIWGLSLDDGREIWRRSLPEGGASPPAAVAGALVVTTSRYGLFLLSPLDGVPIDGLETGSGFAGPAAAFGRRAFAFTNQGVLLSLFINAPESK